MIRFGLLIIGLFLLLSGLGSTPAPVRGQTTPGAGLMIRYPDGRVDSFCVSVPATGITGLEVLQQVGATLRVESGGQGVAVCAINGQGCTDPGAPCFCQCQGGGDCLYWTYYHWQNGRWVAPNVGAGGFTVKPGAIEGWGWGAPPPAPTGAALCALAAPAASPTPRPRPSATPRPPAPPTRRPAPTPTRVRPAPPSATPLPPPLAPSPTPAPSEPPTVAPLPPTETPIPPTLPPPPATLTPIPSTATPTPTMPTPTLETPTPNPQPPTPTPTPNPQPPTTGSLELGGLLAFAAIVGLLLGAMGWLRWRNRGL